MSGTEIRPVIVSHDTVLPPPRPGVRHVRVRGLGVVIADDDLRHRINRMFHWPMILLALAVLPLLAIEFFLDIEKWSALWWGWFSAMAIIWLAFLVEFAIKVTIAECRVEYCKRNWLDMIIILMPALRPLRVASIAKTTRVFTLRGVGFKFARYAATAVIGLEASDRLLRRVGLRSDQSRPEPEQMTREKLIMEVRTLRKLTDAWEVWYAAHEEHIIEQSGTPVLRLPEPPTIEDDEESIREPAALLTDDSPGPVQSPPNANRARTTEPDRGRPARQPASGPAGD